MTGVVSGPRFQSWLFPGAAETMQCLTRAGLHVGIIANTHVPSWAMDHNFRGVELPQYFADRVYSGDEGVEKPDPQIFRIAEGRAQMGGSRLVYIGDRVDKDIAGAQGARR